LLICCARRYRTTPSNEQFARDLYMSSKYVVKVSRETVRKWFKGESFPDLDHLLYLIEWLGLDMSKVFVKNNVITEEHKSTSVNSLQIDTTAISNFTPDQIESFFSFLNSIKDVNLNHVKAKNSR